MIENKSGIMNNTKWEEIRLAMIELPFVVRWRTKDVESGYICDWDAEWFYHFKLANNKVSKDSYKYIEWLEIDLSIERDRILKPLRLIGLPGVVKDSSVMIFGYSNGSPVEYI